MISAIRVSCYTAALRNMFAPLQCAPNEPDRREISTPSVNYHGSVYMRHVFSRDRCHLCSLKTDLHYVHENLEKLIGGRWKKWRYLVEAFGVHKLMVDLELCVREH